MPSRLEMLRPFVEKLLAEGFGVPRVEPDVRGGYWLPPGRELFYLRPVDRDPPTLQVWAVVLRDVELSMELLVALNDINRQVSFAHVVFDDGRVLAVSDLMVETLEAENLAVVCSTVGGIAVAQGPRLQERFGGASTAADAREAPEREVWTGYL
jgi:hypothetical protein